MTAISLLYRGPLSSCNFGCAYCPFAKREEDEPALAADRAALERFASWVESAPEHGFSSVSVFFTPWGEALVRPWYGDAFARLTALPHVRRVAVQTNVAGDLRFLARCPPGKAGIWATWHPGWMSRRRYLAQIGIARAAGASVSAGMVGLREHLDDARALRAELPDDVYLWINAYKDEPGYYAPAEIAAWEAIDPRFRTNLTDHPSRGLPCRTGESVVSVDGDGVVRRCHFVREPIGNLYDPGFPAVLRPRACPNATCGCHIGYVHLAPLGLDAVYGEGILERVIASGRSGSPTGTRSAPPA